VGHRLTETRQGMFRRTRQKPRTSNTRVISKSHGLGGYNEALCHKHFSTP
jgi:hypothetical protein